ncbi:MAG TPA: segregation/condensation protein A [Gemmataceae bacterium]|jgi:segregation and condensation protein A|nr:segregation/condensation protein A [Gemmataceae bacterium]
MLYQVALDSFHGPLDLLLYLVKRHEVDVRDIPVARVAEQFLEHLHAIQVIDVEWAGDFLVMAATLMEIKSRLLLPHSETTPGEEQADPRRELVRQLIEYRKTKDAAGHLDRLVEERQFHIARVPPDDDEGATSPRLRRVELWDLVSAFGRLVRETQALQPQHIVADDTPQAAYQDMIREKLRGGRRLRFRELFDPPYYKARLIGLFLAVLELIKMCEIELDQAEPFGEIWVTRAAALKVVPPAE